jgi:hypothetical protein
MFSQRIYENPQKSSTTSWSDTTHVIGHPNVV